MKTYARRMSKKKRPIVEVDGGEMSVRSEHIARGSRVLEVPQISVRTRLRWDGLAFQVLFNYVGLLSKAQSSKRFSSVRSLIQGLTVNVKWNF